MSLIPRQVKQPRDTVNIRLDREVHETLQQYTTFLDSSRDYVIGQALRVVFAKDREFQAWRTAQTRGPVQSCQAHVDDDADASASRAQRRRFAAASDAATSAAPTPTAEGMRS